MNRTMPAGRPTLRLIARRCGCSPNTVSLALKRDPRVVDARAKEIRAAAEFLGYRPDPKVAQVMSHIARRSRPHLSKLAVLVGADFKQPDPWRNGSWLERFYLSMSQRMIEYGYTFDCFWLGQPRMSTTRIRQVMVHRGIEGLVVFSYARAPAAIDFDFSGFAASVIGRGLAEPRLDATGGNLHNDLDCVVRRANQLGYKRIGLALPAASAARSLHCWEAAYQFYQLGVPSRNRVPACIFHPANPRSLLKWVRRFKPDCIVGVIDTYLALQEFGFSMPKNFGFATLSQDESLPDVAGIDLPHQLIASKAVDIVVEKLRSDKRGLPENPELILYDGKWLDGASLPPR